jgi:hypothetical protein
MKLSGMLEGLRRRLAFVGLRKKGCSEFDVNFGILRFGNFDVRNLESQTRATFFGAAEISCPCGQGQDGFCYFLLF